MAVPAATASPAGTSHGFVAAGNALEVAGGAEECGDVWAGVATGTVIDARGWSGEPDGGVTESSSSSKSGFGHAGVPWEIGGLCEHGGGGRSVRARIRVRVVT